MTQVLEPLLLREHRAQVIERMRRLVCPPATLAGTIIAYQLGLADRDGAPREAPARNLVRPSLCLWAAGACGGAVSAALPLAVSIELFHNFTLIHHDIEDDRREAHERATAWTIWGLGQGVNAGDALHSLALSVLSQSMADDATVLRIFTRVVTAVNESIDGKTRASGATGAALTPFSELKIALRRAGALFGASLEAGAIVAGAGNSTVVALRRAGRLLGAAQELPSAQGLACVARARTLVAGCGISGEWLARFNEMTEYLGHDLA